MDTYFDRFCAAAGVIPLDGESLGYEDQEELVNCLRGFMTYAERHASSRKPGHHIEIGFFSADEVNAFAATWEGQDGIAISWGVVATLREAFMSAMRHPNSFSWIPTEARDAAGTWLYECSKFFVFLHELGHIWNGHTSLLVHRGVAPFIEEIRAFGGGELGNLDRQTMEMDADGFASAGIFSLGVGVMKFPAVHTGIEQEFGPGATQLAMVSLSIYFVFRLFDEAADFDGEENHAHPSPPLRQLIIAASLAAASARAGVFEEDNAWQVILHGMTSAEDVYARHAQKPSDDAAFQAARSKEGKKYIDKLLRHWHILHPQLDQLKRGGILPPTQEILDDD
ncbi:hypothetical protein HFN01_33785 [Rhizobium leguminosarum]|uniref:hypothetical protein n=1 Tax=Rhizobium leguminosarum TaxID=384 RepID=UPI001C94F67A|nr:hypothetical protein [Rhizobium leguminosarum]MBY5399767.1 hypothetical protein [Rhizobium leguminosarum]